MPLPQYLFVHLPDTELRQKLSSDFHESLWDFGLLLWPNGSHFDFVIMYCICCEHCSILRRHLANVDENKQQQILGDCRLTKVCTLLKAFLSSIHNIR